MKTIVIGLGNPILGDDGIGWRVAEEVKKRLAAAPAVREKPGPPVDVEFLSLGGISLMERLIGYERAILIDALAAENETGSVIVRKLSELPDYSARHTSSAHDTSLQNALTLGKTLGAELPDDVVIVGIVARDIYNFSEELTPRVAQAIPRAAQIVMDLLP